jgi:MYXO-CTERM domain-containing protein
MTISVKTLFAGAAVFSVLATAIPASAAAIIGGPFSITNPTGTVPATVGSPGSTIDFTFTLVQPLKNASVSLQLTAQKLISHVSTPELIQFTVSGPGGGLPAQSSQDFSPTVSFSAAPGDYTAHVDYFAVAGETIGGTLTVASAPEPASWAIMLVGFGALGAVLRRRTAARLAM